MKKILTLILVLILTNVFFVHSTLADTKDEKLAKKVKAEIAKLGTGPEAKIQVKLKDKTKVVGYVVETSPDQFIVMDAKTGQNVPIAYPQVRQARGNNLSTGAIIVIGIVGFLVLIFVLASKAS